MLQNHLNIKDTINLGSFYTPIEYIEKCYELISNVTNINNYKILDTACGYGNFFNTNTKIKDFIGIDIDKKAIEKAKSINNNVTYFNLNSLVDINRKRFNINDNDKIIIVGNPPYSNVTSNVNKNVKKENIEMDSNIKTRDLGISFLLSYAKLNPDYICVLHPLSYLIKESNFKLLKEFSSKYILKDSYIINSQVFKNTSKTVGFPIIIALYEKSNMNMSFNTYIKNFSFKTDKNTSFKLNDYDYIDNYITKYPNHKSIKKEDSIAYFYTVRDVNTLKRNKTFIKNESKNTLRIIKSKLKYYCYIDIFKKYIKNIPYYLCNNNIFFNYKKFNKIKNDIALYSIHTNTILKKRFKVIDYDLNLAKNRIDNYFKDLLKEHYIKN